MVDVEINMDASSSA